MGMRWLAVAGLLTLAACGNVPSSGPSAGEIKDTNPTNAAPASYVVVKIDEKASNIAGSYHAPSLSSFFKVGNGLPQLPLAIGDKIQVNIFEAGADGLFSSTTAKATQIASVVDQSGKIFVPYVGPVQASGRSPDSLRETIQAALEDKAIQPQVQVLVAESLANSVTVIGDVNTPGQVPVALSGVRILDLLAAAGGPKGQTYETRVILRRGTTVASADLEDIFDNPNDNVAVRPRDTVLVTSVARTYTVFGATGTRNEFPFATRRLTLAEGLAKAGGLSELLADARGIFLFRFEPDGIAKQLSERAVTTAEGSMVPVVYQLDLKEPKSFFLMQTFELRDEDLIYVATHPSAQFAKFLQIVQPLINNGLTGLNVYERFSRR